MPLNPLTFTVLFALAGAPASLKGKTVVISSTAPELTRLFTGELKKQGAKVVDATQVRLAIQNLPVLYGGEPIETPREPPKTMHARYLKAAKYCDVRAKNAIDERRMKECDEGIRSGLWQQHLATQKPALVIELFAFDEDRQKNVHGSVLAYEPEAPVRFAKGYYGAKSIVLPLMSREAFNEELRTEKRQVVQVLPGEE